MIFDAAQEFDHAASLWMNLSPLTTEVVGAYVCLLESVPSLHFELNWCLINPLSQTLILSCSVGNMYIFWRAGQETTWLPSAVEGRD